MGHTLRTLVKWFHGYKRFNFTGSWSALYLIGDAARVGYFVPLNGPLNGHPPSLYYDGQYGFREKHSTQLAALELIDRITHGLDLGNTPINIYIDLSKAFDTLDHNILISKLQHYGIKGTALQLLLSYLSNRNQFVQHGDILSQKTDILMGVPQGSILGPLLFIIYINDMVHSSELFKFINFAGDTTLITNLKNEDKRNE